MKNDSLNRKNIIDLIISIINSFSSTKSFASFSLDGEQGVGKSYIVNSLDIALREIKKEEDQQYFVIKYNCWEYDYYSEPLNSIILSINNTIDESKDGFNNNFKRVLKEVSIELANLTIERVSLLNPIIKSIIELVKKIGNKLKKQEEKINLIDENYNLKKVLQRIKRNIEKISKEKTIVLIIDELDRCLPEYQIKVLERLHHIFNEMDNVILITVFDKELIINTITNIFGSKISIERYLEKFISFSLNIDIGNYQYSIVDDNIETFGQFKLTDKDRKFVKELISNSNTNIRSMEKVFSNIMLINKVLNIDISHKNYISIVEFEILIILLRLIIKEIKKVSLLNIANEKEIIVNVVNPNSSNDIVMNSARYNKEYFEVLKKTFRGIKEVIDERKVVNTLYDNENANILICKVILSILYNCDKYSWAIWMKKDTIDICKNAMRFINMFYPK